MLETGDPVETSTSSHTSPGQEELETRMKFAAADDCD